MTAQLQKAFTRLNTVVVSVGAIPVPPSSDAAGRLCRYRMMTTPSTGATADAADCPRTLKFFAAKKVWISFADVRDPVSVRPAISALPLSPNK